eukprot:359159-Chlamydomonas_euryale.AAC.24
MSKRTYGTPGSSNVAAAVAATSLRTCQRGGVLLACVSAVRFFEVGASVCEQCCPPKKHAARDDLSATARRCRRSDLARSTIRESM